MFPSYAPSSDENKNRYLEAYGLMSLYYTYTQISEAHVSFVDPLQPS